MDEFASKLFYVLPYDISEELFKQKIGTGDYLNQLQDKGYAERTDQGIRMEKSFLEKNWIKLSRDQKEALHLDIIESFYNPKLNDIHIVDYDDFVQYYKMYINLAYHYKEISRYNDAIKQIACIAKKMQYWGMKEELIELLSNFSDEELNEESRLQKTYYSLFAKVLSFSIEKDNIKELERNFKLLEQTKGNDDLLYFESKNLEGIFWRVCAKDTEKALRLHLDTIKLVDKQVKNKELYNTVFGRIFENLSFCYQQQNNTEKAEEAIEKARIYLESADDTYELAKMYFYKTFFEYNKQPEELLWVPYLNTLSMYLEKNRYPDISRNLYNLLSRIEFERSKKLENFFKFKLRAFDCDLVLYHDYFTTDFISMYNVILENKIEYKDQIVEGLKELVVFFQNTELEDERIFIELIEAYFLGKEYSNKKDLISNQSLVKLFDDFTEK